MKNRLEHIKIANSKSPKKYFKPIKYPEIPLSIDDLYVVTSIGDRLDLLANQFYGDTRLWWIISSANMSKIRRDSYNLKPGIEIRIPFDFSSILEDFEELNS
tara:strand:- start:108 stop:413 length:306 start_codon:yes stop_codon:yes gene_type:complete